VKRERDAFEVAVAAIGRRERSIAELAGWLAERGYPEHEVAGAVERLIECGMLDDERFARLFAGDKRELAGWGPERIAAALRERGLDPSLIEAVCADAHDRQVERAAGLLGARGMALDDDRDRDRALGFLTRRGYGYEAAHAAIRRAEAA
jgi:regulatory protein